MSNKFKQLLQDAKELPSLSTKYDSPKLQHDLQQLNAETNLITSKVDTSSKDNNALGHYFLAQGGANTHENSQYLEKVDTKFTFQPTQIKEKTDVEAHLKQVQETYIKDTIDELNRKTRQTVSSAMIDHRNMYWRSKRNMIIEEWDLEEINKTFGYMGIEDTKAVNAFKDLKKRYAMAVNDINNQRITGSPIPIVKKFADMAQTATCTNSQKLTMKLSWDIISRLTNESSDCIHGAYLVSNPEQSRIASMKSQLIRSARLHLESQSVVNETLKENAAAANVGGSLSEKHRLKAYMKLQYKKKGSSWNSDLEVYDDVPIWLFTYLLVRCGYYDLALQYVEEKTQNFSGAPEFYKVFKEFCTDADFNVSEDHRIQFERQYMAMKYTTKAHDPFKVLLYKIIGRCELQTKSEDMIYILEDSLWLQLMLIRETSGALKSNRAEYRLSEFQQMVSQADSSKYDKNGTNPWVYFNMLLLSLQFEKAINYLHGFENWRVQAVHLAVVFVYYGLVRVASQPSNIYEIVVSNSNGTPCLNYIGMIAQYIQVNLDECQDALQYLYLLTLYPNPTVHPICYEKIVEQIVRCDNFKDILGNKAKSRSGIIDKYKPLLGFHSYSYRDYEDLIVTPVARALQSRGRYKDSVYVFESLDKYEQVFGVLNQEIYVAINGYNTSDKKDSLIPSMQDIMAFCSSTRINYDKSPASKRDSSTLLTFNILVNFLKATIENHYGHSENALECIKQTDLLPQGPEFDMVQKYVQGLLTQHDYVRNLLPYMILIAVGDKSQCRSITYFLTFSKLQMPITLHQQIDQKLMQFNV
ncbi:hypothetical protein PS6_006675 [Mucor atramentarius]